MKISDVLQRIDHATGRFEREAVEAAILQKEDIAPHLMRILENLLEILENSPETYAKFDPVGDYTAHLYAMFLLGEVRERRAHSLILRFAVLPGELLETVLGSFMEREFNIALMRTASNIRGICSLIENGQVDENVRVGCIDGLVRLVGREELERDNVILYFHELFHGKLERKPSMIWNTLVGNCTQLAAYELLPEVRLAHEEGLIDSAFDMEFLEEALSDTFGETDRLLFQWSPEQRDLGRMTGEGWWTPRQK